MHKKFRITLVIVLMLMFMTMPSVKSYAASSSPAQSMLPSINTMFKGSKNKYLNTYRDNYYLDLKESGIFKAFNMNILNSFANVIFSFQENITYVLIVIIYYSFKVSFVQICGTALTTVVGSLKVSLYDELSQACISLLAVFFILKVIKDQKTQIWMAMLQTVLIVAIGVYFFAQPVQFVNNLDNVSQDLSQMVLTGVYKSTNNGDTPDSAVEAVCNNIWVMFVHEPWQMLEFGDKTLAAKQEDSILKLQPESTERQKIINDIAKDKEHFQSIWGLERLAMVFLYTIPLFVMWLILAILALLILVYNVLLVVTAAMGPFIILLSIIPFFGFKLLGNWFGKLLSYAMMKLVVSFVITITFCMMTSIYTVGEKLKYGWVVIIILQVVMMFAVYWKRDKFIDMITALRQIPQGGHHAISKELKKNVNIEARLKKIRRNNGDDVNSNRQDKTLGRFKRRSNMTNETSVPHGKYENNSSNYYRENNSNKNGSEPQNNENVNGSNTNKSSPNNRTDLKNAPASNNVAVAKMTDDALSNYDDSMIEELKVGQKNQSSNNKRLKELVDRAEEILEKQYEKSKIESEEKANKTGSKPKYTKFVLDAMDRQKMRLPKFEERQKMALVNDMRRILKAGGNIDGIYANESEVSEEIQVQRPEDIISNMDNKKEVESTYVPKVDSIKEYTKEFNESYGTNYSKQFMGNMINKYGQDNVRRSMDYMKKINEVQPINTPASYLRTSLEKGSIDTSEENNLRSSNDTDLYYSESDKEKFSDVNNNEEESMYLRSSLENEATGNSENIIPDGDFTQSNNSSTNKTKYSHEHTNFEKSSEYTTIFKGGESANGPVIRGSLGQNVSNFDEDIYESMEKESLQDKDNLKENFKSDILGHGKQSGSLQADHNIKHGTETKDTKKAVVAKPKMRNNE